MTIKTAYFLSLLACRISHIINTQIFLNHSIPFQQGFYIFPHFHLLTVFRGELIHISQGGMIHGIDLFYREIPGIQCLFHFPSFDFTEIEVDI